MKKTISLLLAALLLISVIPFGVFAQETELWETVNAAMQTAPVSEADVEAALSSPVFSGVAAVDIDDNCMYEKEPNSDWSQAENIYHDYTIYGELSGKDVDFYKFVVNKESTLTLSCAATTQGVGIVLYDSDHEGLSVAHDLGSVSDGFYGDAMYGTIQPGTYYLAFLETNQSASTYGFYFTLEPLTTVRTVPMYRMYDPNSGEHFYTGSTAERDWLVSVGWHYEGVGFNFPEEGTPVYRLYEPVYGEHLYTKDLAEIDKLVGWGWRNEGVAFNSAESDAVPQYRLRNPNSKRGAYHFTGSAQECQDLVNVGWIYEGIGWYSCEE